MLSLLILVASRQTLPPTPSRTDLGHYGNITERIEKFGGWGLGAGGRETVKLFFT